MNGQNPLCAPAIEYRTLPAGGRVDVRQENGGPVIAGIAAPFGKFSRNLGGFVEEVSPHAFDSSRALGWPDVVARFQHSDLYLLGSSHSIDRPEPTLRLSITPAGLRYEVTPPRSRADVVELIERRDVRFSSFAFRVLEDRWSTTQQGFPLRILLDVELVDVAPVTSPAYVDTSSALRSLALAADVDLGEVRKLAATDNLGVLYGRAPRPQPMPHTNSRLLGAAARHRLLELDGAKGRG